MPASDVIRHGAHPRVLDAARVTSARLVRYGLAVASAVALLVLLRALQAPLEGVLFTIPIAAVALVSIALGTGPGALLALLLGFGIWLFVQDPQGSFRINGPLEGARLLAFFAASAAVVAGIAVTQRTRRRMAVARSEAERALVSERAVVDRLRVLTEAMPQVVFTLRPDGSTAWVNANWTRYSGLDADAINERGWDAFVHPDDVTRAREAWTLALAGRGPDDSTLRLRARDGSYRWFLVKVVPLRGRDGRPTEWIGTATDIHDRKQAEEALREVNSRLVEADARKNEFLAMLSHELRNPLAPIRNSLYVLDRAAPGGTQARRAQVVIDRQVQQLTRLIDDLLDVTRISRGKITLRPRPVDLDELARRTAEDHRELFVARGIELEVAGASRHVWVHGDETRLAQVVGNLLQNAAKFTPRGGRTDVRVEGARGTARIHVRDTGAGIPAEILPRLFEPFTQAEKTLDRTHGGLGLGLALVKGLVELHGGRVAARSEGPGTGAEFTVELPLQERTAHPVAAAPAPAQATGAGRRVLVIEDNLDAALSLKEVLALGAHVVEVAHTGAEGLEKARAFRPDTVLCDIGLPGMDGFAVARAIRDDSELRTVQLIALTGYALPEDVQRARDAGFDRHLAKPPDLGELDRLLRS